jgi:multicomponent Na+:H+ antiporter subunit A
VSAGQIVPRALLAPQAHEVLVAALVMFAAFTAVRARRTMTAVLSLGTAGYGVALTFSLYGAPDLAMTQFAVETLTAVIFVYVFWQFPQVVERSTRRTRVRDGVISVATGLLITVLTFSAAMNPTNSRLRDFYAQAAPALAHGRNVVNVILVDFRALDTLGEITVLVTAAVGVAALLRIAAAERATR